MLLKHQISIEGSCDTEDWSNDAGNSALLKGINYILKYIKIENYFKRKNISQYYCSYYVTVFVDQINAAVVSIRDLF